MRVERPHPTPLPHACFRLVFVITGLVCKRFVNLMMADLWKFATFPMSEEEDDGSFEHQAFLHLESNLSRIYPCFLFTHVIPHSRDEKVVLLINYPPPNMAYKTRSQFVDEQTPEGQTNAEHLDDIAEPDIEIGGINYFYSALIRYKSFHVEFERDFVKRLFVLNTQAGRSDLGKVFVATLASQFQKWLLTTVEVQANHQDGRGAPGPPAVEHYEDV